MSTGTVGANRASAVQERVIMQGVRNSLELAIRRRSERSIRRIITRVDSPDLIAGVTIEPLKVHPDGTGFFAELARLVWAGIAARMIPEGKGHIQVSTTPSNN